MEDQTTGLATEALRRRMLITEQQRRVREGIRLLRAHERNLDDALLDAEPGTWTADQIEALAKRQ